MTSFALVAFLCEPARFVPRMLWRRAPVSSYIVLSAIAASNACSA
jgi:hypothetical protein